MRKANRILWGVVLIAAGVLLVLNALKITNVDLFFDGWWTLFIIVPCAIGLFSEREKTGNFLGLLIGVLLLLSCQGVLRFAMVWKLLLPAIIILAGLKLIFGGALQKKHAQAMEDLQKSGAARKVGAAVFSGQEMNFAGEVFHGAALTAVFGGVECDLRQAVIDKDCVITAVAVFGGVDILLPPDVKVEVKSVSLFGGVSDKSLREKGDNAVTVYVDATCVFGGVDIK